GLRGLRHLGHDRLGDLYGRRRRFRSHGLANLSLGRLHVGGLRRGDGIGDLSLGRLRHFLRLFSQLSPSRFAFRNLGRLGRSRLRLFGGGRFVPASRKRLDDEVGHRRRDGIHLRRVRLRRRRDLGLLVLARGFL